MSIKTLYVLFPLLFIALTHLHAAADSSLCLNKAEMGLEGVVLGDRLEQVKEHLGEPHKTSLRPAKFSVPGSKTGWIYYHDMDIYFHASRVQRLIAKTDRVSTKSGLRVDLTYTDTSNIVGFDINKVKHFTSGTYEKFFIPVCPYKEIEVEQFVVLFFGTAGRISTIEIFWVAP